MFVLQNDSCKSFSQQLISWKNDVRYVLFWYLYEHTNSNIDVNLHKTDHLSEGSILLNELSSIGIYQFELLLNDHVLIGNSTASILMKIQYTELFWKNDVKNMIWIHLCWYLSLNYRSYHLVTWNMVIFECGISKCFGLLS